LKAGREREKSVWRRSCGRKVMEGAGGFNREGVKKATGTFKGQCRECEDSKLGLVTDYLEVLSRFVRLNELPVP
jgi:hypothetical protein